MPAHAVAGLVEGVGGVEVEGEVLVEHRVGTPGVDDHVQLVALDVDGHDQVRVVFREVEKVECYGCLHACGAVRRALWRYAHRVLCREGIEC